jgi:hypothetical protein
MSETSEKFKKNKYVVVRLAIDSDLQDLVTQYALFDEIQDFHPDIDHVVGAHFKYADPLTETLLLTLQPIMEENTGLKLLPTYSFFRVYRPGDELTPHTDRPSCEISATVCFNFFYNDPNYSWPIFMDDKPIELHPGDMAIYRGCEVNHWREKLTASEGAWHVQGFFHYVDANGPHTKWKFDRRENIGDPMYQDTDEQPLDEEKAMQRLQLAKKLGYVDKEKQLEKLNAVAEVPKVKSYISFTS